MPRRWLETILVVGFLLAVAMASIQGLFLIDRDTREQVGNALETVLESVDRALHLWEGGHVKEAKALSEGDQLADLAWPLVAAYQSGLDYQDQAMQEPLRRHLRPIITDKHYLGFFVIAPDGRSLASMRNSNIGTINLIEEKRPDLLDRVMQGETVLVPTLPSDVKLPGYGGSIAPPTLFVATPLKQEDGTVFAVFTLRIDALRDFNGVTTLGRIGKTGETYAFNTEGFMMSESRFVDQLRELKILNANQTSALTVRVTDPGVDLVKTRGKEATAPRDQSLTTMAASAILGNRGTNTDGYRDYRGVRVFGSWLWDQKLNIGLATEIDAVEAMQPYYRARMIITSIAIVTALLAIFMTFYIARVRSRSLSALEKAHGELEERVKLRTRDLTVANQRLEKQIADRVRAEDELKRTQSLLQMSNSRLREMAMSDGLTGLANRRAFDTHLKNEWKRASRTGDPLSLLLFDVDYFKRYNDSHGHQAGDDCLTAIGQALKLSNAAGRPGDMIARYGGEEFAVVLGNCAHDHAMQVAEKLAGQVRDLGMPHYSTEVRGPQIVTVSIGAATIQPDNKGGPDTLVAMADKALYKAKAGGRNRVEGITDSGDSRELPDNVTVLRPKDRDSSSE